MHIFTITVCYDNSSGILSLYALSFVSHSTRSTQHGDII